MLLDVRRQAVAILTLLGTIHLTHGGPRLPVENQAEAALEAAWLKTCRGGLEAEFLRQKAARDAFYEKLLQCKEGGVHMWGFGSLLNAFSIPKPPSQVHPYVVKGLKRDWSEVGGMAIEASRNASCPGGFSSHAPFLRDKPAWADRIWCREVTGGRLVLEFIYVPPRLKHLMAGQKYFHWESSSNPAPPDATMADACLYTNVPAEGTATAHHKKRPLLQTYVDTVLLGALALGGESYVHRVILTTGMWPRRHWVNDRHQPLYVRSPEDLFCAYAGQPLIHSCQSPNGVACEGRCSKLIEGYRFDWDECTAYQAARGNGQRVCEILAVTDALGAPVKKEAWVKRAEAFVDATLAAVDVRWFTPHEAADAFGVLQPVYMMPSAAKASPPWTGSDKGSYSLLASRKQPQVPSEHCGRSESQGARPSCTDGICSPTWLSQRPWMQRVADPTCPAEQAGIMK